MAADPIPEMALGLALGNFHAVVHASNAHALRDQRVEDLRAILLDGWMPTSAVSKENHAVGIIEGRIVFGPAVAHNTDLQAVNRGERLFQEIAARIEFVVPGAVALDTRDQIDNALFRS